MAFFNMSCLGLILQVRGHDGMSTPQNGVAAYSQSHISHICQGGFPLLSCGFIFLSVLLLWWLLPNCRLQRLSSDLTVFSQQPASDVDFACPDFEMLPDYLYLVAAPWWVYDLTQLLPFFWPEGTVFVCIIHLKAAIAHRHNVDAPAITNLILAGGQ